MLIYGKIDRRPNTWAAPAWQPQHLRWGMHRRPEKRIACKALQEALMTLSIVICLGSCYIGLTARCALLCRSCVHSAPQAVPCYRSPRTHKSTKLASARLLNTSLDPRVHSSTPESKPHIPVVAPRSTNLGTQSSYWILAWSEFLWDFEW